MRAAAAEVKQPEPAWIDRRLAEKMLGVGARTVQRLARRGLVRTKIVPRAGGGISYLYAEEDIERLGEVRRAGKQWVAAAKTSAVSTELEPPAKPALALAPLEQALGQLARALRQPAD